MHIVLKITNNVYKMLKFSTNLIYDKWYFCLLKMIQVMQPNKCILCDSFSGKQNDTTCQVEINVSLKKEVPIFSFHDLGLNLIFYCIIFLMH